MKLITLKCPSCGAKLEVSNSIKQYTCEYCGVTTVLDDESVVVKNVSSKLQNALLEIKEYFDNGNYKKSFVLSNELIKEYPKNKEIKDYLDKSKEKLEDEYEKEQELKRKQEEERQQTLEEERKKRLEEQQRIIQQRNQIKLAKKAKRAEAVTAVGIGFTTGATGILFILCKIGVVIAYFCGVVLILAGLIGGPGDFIIKTTCVLTGLSLFKLFYTFLAQKINMDSKTCLWMRIVVPFTILMIGALLSAIIFPENYNANDQKNTTETTTTTVVVSE